MTTRAEQYENEVRVSSEDSYRFIQAAGHSQAARFHLEDDPENMEKCAYHSKWLADRLLGCIAEECNAAFKADFIKGNDLSPTHDLYRANELATHAAAFFGSQVSLAWEREIINSVVANRDKTQDERVVAYTGLKKTFSPLSISVRGGSPTLKIGQEVPRLISPGEVVSEMSPKIGSPVVLDFRNFPETLSEGDGNLITVDSPRPTIVGDKVISYSHSNEAIYQVERYSAESGEPNPISVAFVQMGTAESVSVSLYKTFRDNPTLARGDVSRTLLGIRSTITRVETDAPEEE